MALTEVSLDMHNVVLDFLIVELGRILSGSWNYVCVYTCQIIMTFL